MEREVMEVQGAGIKGEGSMKNVRDEDSIVDRIPAYKSGSRRANASLMSCMTNHTMRTAEDKSVVTFATTTMWGERRGGVVFATDVIGKVPSLPPVRGADCDASIITDNTVQVKINCCPHGPPQTTWEDSWWWWATVGDRKRGGESTMRTTRPPVQRNRGNLQSNQRGVKHDHHDGRLRGG